MKMKRNIEKKAKRNKKNFFFKCLPLPRLFLIPQRPFSNVSFVSSWCVLEVLSYRTHATEEEVLVVIR